MLPWQRDERVGIQIETFDAIRQPFSYVMDQILACTSIEKILPRVPMEQSESIHLQPKTPKSVAVLVSSSNSGYYEKLKSIYEDHTPINGEMVSIYQFTVNVRVREWILLIPGNENDRSMPAHLAYRHALSIEPCFQAPPLFDCNSKNKLYSRSVVDHVRFCEDMIDGIKLVDGLSDDIS